MPQPVNNPGDLLPGELFEDCRYHPCLCIEGNSPDDLDGIYGISLIDGTPSGCSIANCALRKLTVEEAVRWKYYGPMDEVVEDRWWERFPQVPREAVNVPNDLKPYFECTFILCAAICNYCGAEQAFRSDAEPFSDEWYLDMAIAMKDANWIIPELQVAACAQCAKLQKLSHDASAYSE